MSERKRLLNDLRVIDLRSELEKRNLDKSGVRGVLLQRLMKHLEQEGLDPETYKFDLTTPEPKTPAKRTRRSESTVEPESEETPAMEDMIVQDDVGEDDEPDQLETAEAAELETDPTEQNMEEDGKPNRKRELKDEDEASEPKKPCLKEEAEPEEDNKTIENNDAEDSINLDLGEDELLNEETDNTTRNKKDEASDDAPAAAADVAPGDDQPHAGDASADNQQELDEAPATSNETDEKKDKDQKDDKDKEDGDKKEKKDETKEGGARNLWVSGLSGDTRAKDLKQLCSKHGKVIGAKVVTNARTPGSRCYGYVTMASAADAESCIKNLHRTELHGRMISVEKAKSESESAARRQPARAERRRDSRDQPLGDKDEEGKENADKSGEGKKKDGDVSGAETNRSESREKRTEKDKAGRRSTRSRERRRSPRGEVLSFSKIWKERDQARARERSRAQREEERRRRAAEEALRDRERRQRQEKHRLAVEREKLRAEREKIEREKNELLRLERERHRLEREKLELERLELKRAQLRLEEERRKRGYEGSGAYRKAPSPPPEPAYERDPRDPRDPRHKRAPPPPMVRNTSSRSQFEAPPPPRFEMPAPAYERDKRDRDRDYKRDYPRHVSSTNMKYPANGGSSEDSRQPVPPGTRPKEPSRSYGEPRDARAYRPSPPGKPEPRSWPQQARSYADPPTAKGKGSSGAGDSWQSSGATGGASGERYAYEARYPPAYQPPPPGAAYPDRGYAPTRDYRKY